jgi:uncharacterized protein DUF4242
LASLFSNEKKFVMKKFVIERNFPGAGEMSADELRSVSAAWSEAIEELRKPHSWLHSYITEDKIYCVHMAESKEAIREHSRIAKFPINTICEVKTMLGPTKNDPVKAS